MALKSIDLGMLVVGHTHDFTNQTFAFINSALHGCENCPSLFQVVLHLIIDVVIEYLLSECYLALQLRELQPSGTSGCPVATLNCFNLLRHLNLARPFRIGMGPRPLKHLSFCPLVWQSVPPL